ncbi:MAG: hypothetical protein WCH58_04495 [Candidatus Saccharibacteria bacterium]
MRLSRLKYTVLSLFMIMSVGGVLTVTAVPQAAGASDVVAKCNTGFLGFPAWYNGLTNDDCSIKSPESAGGLSKFIWRIGLNVVDIALVAASYVAAYFILYGGFLFLTSQGDPADAARARSTMLDAVIGLAISMGAVILINFIFAGIGL